MRGVPGEPPVVHLDGQRTWPAAVREFAEHWAGELGGSSECAGDLRFPERALAEFTALIRSSPVRAYHCTRLLDEEAADIRSGGLRPLTVDLVEARIRAACAGGWLTLDEGEALLSGNAVDCDRGQRFGQVCAVAGRSLLDEDPGAVEMLLSTWGGEVIYRAHERTALGARLRSMGTPAIVAVNLRLRAHSRAPRFWPPLACLFTGRLLGLPDTWGDVFFYGPVAAADVAAIWQPGDREYDRHARLPKR